MDRHLGCSVLIENPSAYLTFTHSTFTEPDFLSCLVEATDCRLLLDLNNAVVTCYNTGVCLQDWMTAFPLNYVREIHLAGHAEKILDGGVRLKIDDHGCVIPNSVLSLLGDVMKKCSAPILIEWDTNIPSFRTLMNEVVRVDEHLQRDVQRVDA